ncbi:MAG TPA: CsiV family protein [Steroidobacteraceae bacterium]|nr:CsiV family protein [Steroidobacteraceae bacterium]
MTGVQSAAKHRPGVISVRPWFAALAAACICWSAHPQQPAGGAPLAPRSTPSVPGAATAGAAPAAAAPRAPVYRVELVVFRALSAPGGAENWSIENGSAAAASPQLQPQTETASAAVASEAAPTAAQQAAQQAVVRPLPASEFQLDGVAARLRSSGRFLPVAHVEWSQIASPWGHAIEIPVQSVGLDTRGLSGTVSLQRGEFLHLELSLDYAIDDPPQGLRAAPGTVFTLHEMHRMRFYERNYFDHPAFGVIALVTPLQDSPHARK